MSMPSVQPPIITPLQQPSDDAPCIPSRPAAPRKPAATTTSTAGTRKRSKNSSDNENGEDEGEEKKRSRGRPRLDTKDETAADRRRTQIRLAQRAYRNRKDTAITSLEQKVKELEDANEDMSKEFMSFYDFVLSQGMLQGAPEVARRLNDTTRKFLSLARKSGDENAQETSEANPPQEPRTDAYAQRKDSKQSSGTSPSQDGNSSSSKSQIPDASSMSANYNSTSGFASSMSDFNTTSSLPYEVITQPTMDNASFPLFDAQDQIPFFDTSFPASPFNPMPAPSTFSFQERSFGRRLQRATLEAGFRLVSMPNPPPHRYAAVFGFCLLFEPRESIIRRISHSLSMTRDESMYVWKYPFTNLGGAGTWFPDSGQGRGPAGTRAPLGNQGVPELFKPPEMTGFSMGPFNQDIESAREDRVDHRMRMMFKGFEGDFYDADEVDTYLQQRGIIIPENADYIEAEIDIATFEEFSDLGPIGGGFVGEQGYFGGMQLPSPGMARPGQPSGMNAMGNLFSGHTPTTTASSMLGSSLVSAPIGSQLGSLVPDLAVSAPLQPDGGLLSFAGAPGFPQNAWSPPTWTKTRVMIDVTRLVTEMTGRAVCLGRTPGLRPKDVNTAVRIAAGLAQAP